MEKKKQLQKSLPWIVLIAALFLACFGMDNALADTLKKEADIPDKTSIGQAELLCKITGREAAIQGKATGERTDFVSLEGSESNGFELCCFAKEIIGTGRKIEIEVLLGMC